MEEKQLDSVIRETLCQASRNLEVSQKLENQIYERISEHNIKEDLIMKRFRWKKIVAATVVFCVLSSMAAVAAGKITGLVSSSDNTQHQYPAFADLENAPEKLGYPIQAVEAFSNGYHYKDGNIQEVSGVDDAMNKVASYQELWLRYENQEGSALNLNICKPLEMEEDLSIPPKATQTVDGVTVNYYCDRYIFLPPDETPTEEELAAQERRELYISYGSQERQEEFSYHAGWEVDGVSYSLMGMGGADEVLDAEQMFALAGEVLGAE